MADGGSEMLEAERLAGGGNRLLATMTAADLRRLAQGSRTVRFTRGEPIMAADVVARWAFFIESGVASIVRPDGGERQTELCLAGSESFLGAPLVMADGRWCYDTIAQTDEIIAVRVNAGELKTLFDESVAFRSILLAAVHLQTLQIAEGLASAAWQQIAARLARWLLLYRDRLGSDRIEVTHEFMALMVGAQRPRITGALHELESDGAIRANRGHVLILDEVRLEAIADGGYGRAEREAQRLSRAAAPMAQP